MKKTYIITISVLALACFSSCFNKVENLFDQTSSERLIAKTEECRTLLTQAQYGWNIQYYPSTTREFGGTNFVAKFEADGTVSVSAEIASDASKFVKSHYSLNNSQSVVLAFDTYNDYIHYWSDPDETLENTFGGDYEWTYIEGDSETLVFKGVKTGNTIIFKALKEEMLPAIKKIVNIREKAFLNIEYIWNDGSPDGTAISVDEDYSVLYYRDEDGMETAVPFTYTSTGIVLYSPTEINGIIFNEFAYDIDTHCFTATDAVDASGAPATVEWQGEYTADLISYESFLGTWDIHYKMSGSSLTRTVQIVQQQYNRSYVMKGLLYDVVIYYDKKTAPQLYVQIVDAYNGILFCVWETENGRFSISVSDGVYLNYTTSAVDTRLNLSDISTFKTTGFLFYNQYTDNELLQDTPSISYFLKK